MEVRKSILIIKANSKALAPVEVFLKNRGWVIFGTADLKDAFAYLMKNKPSFVMLAVDHPLKKVRSLPKLIIQAFPVCLIAYVENSNTQSYKLLMDCGVEYKVNPPATGPAVERAVNKFMKDQQILANQAQARAEKFDLVRSLQEKKTKNAEAAEQVASLINLQNQERKDSSDNLPGTLMSNPTEAPLLNQESGSTDFLAALIKQIAETDVDPEILMAEAMNTPQGLAYRPAEFEAKKTNTYFNPQEESLPENETAKILETKNKKNKKPSTETETSSSSSSKKGFAPQYNEDDIFDESGALKQTEAPVLNFDKKPNKPSIVARENDSEDVSEAETLTPERLLKKNNKSKDQQVSEAEDRPKISQQDPAAVLRSKTNISSEAPMAPEMEAKKSKTQILESLNQEARKVNDTSGQSQRHESLMSQGVEKALNDSVNKGDGKLKQKLQASSSVACIAVESARFSGYLVAAMGKNRKIDQKFLAVIKDRLLKFLKEQGEEIKEEEGLSINIKEVDFEGWALEYADFLRKSIHNGDELAMAFFPFSPIKNELGRSAAVEMGAIKLEDLQGDLQVEFNLYIYLAANNRYVLYTPKGSKFYGQLKERLSKMGVTHLHIRKSEAQDLSKYRAQNYLNTKISEYEQKKGLARSA